MEQLNDGTINNMKKLQHSQISKLDFFNTIFQFRECAKLCEKPQLMSNGVCKMLWAPGFCSYSFACELEMKFIYFITYETLPSHVHGLDSLFDILPNDIQIKIINSLASYCSKDEFDKNLKDYSRIFEQWRYKYEYSSINTMNKGFLIRFESILYNIAQNLAKSSNVPI